MYKRSNRNTHTCDREANSCTILLWYHSTTVVTGGPACGFYASCRAVQCYTYRAKKYHEPWKNRQFKLWEEEEDGGARGHAVMTYHQRRLVSTRVFRFDLSYRLYPSPFSNVSNEYVARCARSWCRSPYLILLPFHLGRVIEIHGDIFVSNAFICISIKLIQLLIKPVLPLVGDWRMNIDRT